jgi:hypothetical protein
VHINRHRAVIQCPNLPPLHCPTAPDGLIDVPEITATATHNTPLPDQPFQAHATIGNSNHPADLVAFHHATLFSPSLTTLEQAMIKQYLPPLPGFNIPTLRRFRPDLEATTMGHLDARRKNINSTKPRQQPTSERMTAEDGFPTQQTTRSHHCYLTIVEPKQLVYTDQTGRLPTASSTGHNYLMIAYDYDSNNILLRPFKSRAAEVLRATIKDIHLTLTNGGCQPKFHRMDNECSKEVKEFFTQNHIT